MSAAAKTTLAGERLEEEGTAGSPSERDDYGIWGGVNFADARSLASAWRGSSRHTLMSVPRGMACWGTGLGTKNLCGCAAVALLALLTRRFGAE